MPLVGRLFTVLEALSYDIATPYIRPCNTLHPCHPPEDGEIDYAGADSLYLLCLLYLNLVRMPPDLHRCD